MKTDPLFSGNNTLDINKKDETLLKMYTSLLYNDNGSIIDTAIDELPIDPLFPHPLTKFYKKYCKRLKISEESIFIPYNAAINVLAFQELSEFLINKGIQMPKFQLLGARSLYKLNPEKLKIGILTAGGNAPGLNMVIDSIVKRHSLLATKQGAKQLKDGTVEGLKFIGYSGGYPGLIKDDKIELNVHYTDQLSDTAGCVLGMRRGETPEELFKKQNIPPEKAQEQLSRQMVDGITRDNLDILYVIGGNGTISAADQLCQQLKKLNVLGENGQLTRVLAAPKTMDNDVHFTDYTFGFRTTVEKAVGHIKDIHSDAETCGRVAILEFFGAASGFVALHAAYASGVVDYVLIPEMLKGNYRDQLQEFDHAAEHITERFNKRGHAILIVAEGATMIFHKNPGGFKQGQQAAKQIAFEHLVEYLKLKMKDFNNGTELPIFTIQPKHLVRSGAPNSADIDLCKQTGKLIVDAALSGMSRCVVACWYGNFVAVPMRLAVQHQKQVNIGGYYFLSMMEKYLL